LKSKAFSQDVYRVSFSQFNENWLTTSGTGHIRFWKISETFTGLKLQGDIAKFGQFELSDVCSYAEFEDGNVLSSSEYGKLLLWEGNLVKSVVSIDAERSCHDGQIEFVRHHNKKIITAGADGFVRFWDAQAINQGESD
jgi:WD40 repeat protein